MTPPPSPPLPDGDEPLHDVAAGWAARQRSGAMTGQEERDLQAWLERDPEHRAMFDHVQAVWRASAALRTDPQIMAMRDAAMHAYPGRRRRWYLAGGLAAALAVAVLAGWTMLDRPAGAPLPWAEAHKDQLFTTGVGQTATVTLPDGSIVTLDTDTRLKSWDTPGRRLVRLEKGQAFFRVAHDASRPFIVSAGGQTITAVGTAFNVRLAPNRVEVILAEGRVKVSGTKPGVLGAPRRKAPVTEMTAGSRLVAAGSDDWRIARVDVGEATSWRIGQLVFVRRPLGEVAEELNRYSQKKLVIGDDGLAAAQITGGFAAGDVDGFVRAVEGYGLASVVSDDDRAVVLRAR
jgi:transmembrane sensor